MSSLNPKLNSVVNRYQFTSHKTPATFSKSELKQS